MIQMAELPSTEDSARALLNIFLKHSIRPNEVMMIGTIRGEWSKNHRLMREEDLLAALSYAEEHGWIVNEGSKIRLTEKGYKEI